MLAFDSTGTSADSKRMGRIVNLCLELFANASSRGSADLHFDACFSNLAC